MNNTRNSVAASTRRSFLAQGSILLAGHYALTGAQSAAESEAPRFVEVRTAYGRLRGMANKGLVTFKGIPYAGSVAGANRFKAAPHLKPWSGVRDALKFGTPAMQEPGRPSYGTTEPLPGEDCLYLNIWTPAMKPDGTSMRTIVPEAASYMPNDLVSDSQGGFYFSDFRGISTEPKGGAYYVSPDFKTITPVLPHLAMANGIAAEPRRKAIVDHRVQQKSSAPA